MNMPYIQTITEPLRMKKNTLVTLIPCLSCSVYLVLALCLLTEVSADDWKYHSRTESWI